MSVGHLDHVVIVYSSMEHVTWKSPGPICVWLSWYDPASRFMHIGVFLIQSASFIHLVCRCASLSTTFPLSQSIQYVCVTDGQTDILRQGKSGRQRGTATDQMDKRGTLDH